MSKFGYNIVHVIIIQMLCWLCLSNILTWRKSEGSSKQQSKSQRTKSPKTPFRHLSKREMKWKWDIFALCSPFTWIPRNAPYLSNACNQAGQTIHNYLSQTSTSAQRYQFRSVFHRYDPSVPSKAWTELFALLSHSRKNNVFQCIS